jgi:hypothetical protein
MILRAAETVSCRKEAAMAGISREPSMQALKPRRAAIARKAPKKKRLKKQNSRAVFFTL